MSPKQRIKEQISEGFVLEELSCHMTTIYWALAASVVSSFVGSRGVIKIQPMPPQGEGTVKMYPRGDWPERLHSEPRTGVFALVNLFCRHLQYWLFWNAALWDVLWGLCSSILPIIEHGLCIRRPDATLRGSVFRHPDLSAFGYLFKTLEKLLIFFTPIGCKSSDVSKRNGPEGVTILRTT